MIKKLLRKLLPYIARLYAHYGLAIAELNYEWLRAEIIADVRAQLHDAMLAVNGGLPDRGVSTIATNRPSGGIPGATPNAPAPGAGPGTPTDKVVTTNAGGAHDSTNRTAARVGFAPGAHVLAFLLMGLVAAGLHAAPEPDPLNVIRHAFALPPQGGASGPNGRFDSNGYLYVDVAAGGGAGGTSSSFAAAFPGTGTAIGAKNGANMVNLVADNSGNLDVNCAVGCSGGATTPTDAFANPTTASLSFSFLAGYNGTTWDLLRDDGSKHLYVNVANATLAVTQSGNFNTRIVGNSGTILDGTAGASLPGGALQLIGSDYGTACVGSLPCSRVPKIDSSGYTYVAYGGGTFPVSGTFWQATQPVSEADGADTTLGAKADAKSTATDTTAITIMQVLKEISNMEQNPASRAVTNAGTFADQATLQTSSGTDIGKLDANQSVNEAQINGHTAAECGLNGCNAVGGAAADGSAATTDPVPIEGKGAAGVGRVPIVCDSWAPFSLASTTALKIISNVSGKLIYVCSINIVVAGANNVALIDGTKTTNDCDTATHGMAGGTTAATGWNFAANGGLTMGSGIGVVAATATASHDVCLLASANTQVSGVVSWTDI